MTELVKTIHGREYRMFASPEHAAALLRDPRYRRADTPETDTLEQPSAADGLIERAHALGLGAPSQLRRWSAERLMREIDKAERAAGAED